MRYERVEDLLKLAVTMQGSAEGASLGDIMEEFGVSRRTAERMRDAVLRAFPQAEEAAAGDNYKRWRIPPGTIDRLMSVTAGELAELQQAARRLEREGLADQAATLSGLAGKVAALIPRKQRVRLEPDMELLLQTEGLAMRPGPRARIADGVLEALRRAILASERVWLHYRSGSTGEASRQPVEPYGLLYGNRPYLVAFNLNDWAMDYRLFRLSGVERVERTGESFERREDFSLQEYTARSFGMFQEEPVDVAWRFSPEAAPDARNYLFHPTQTMEDQPDGGLIVRFHAGGMREMAWHLYTWGDAVEVLEPKDFWERVEGEW
jgi:predicted DNA-binding transcriptional regulator YafY